MKKFVCGAALAAIFAPSALAQSVVAMGEDGAEAIEAAGCEVTDSISELDIYQGNCPSEVQVAALRADNSVVGALSPSMNWMGGDEGVKHAAVTDGDEWFRADQWSLDAVNANAAWDQGYTGAGVRVAILDSGLYPFHPDLQGNVNWGLATSFIPGEGPDSYADFNHGTHVAGIIGAEDNGIGTIGIAPGAEIVPIKVLSAVDGYGEFFGIWSGMVYAANIGADVMNMSLGAVIPRNGFVDDFGNRVTAGDIRSWFTISIAVANYVHGMGTANIVAAGNDSIDFDRAAALWSLPSQFPHTISVSATGPQGFAYGASNFDIPAVYTNYGNSLVDIAGPGGNVDLDLYFNNVPGWWMDLVLSTVPVHDPVYGVVPAWGFMAGTSMAAPAVTGVAALVIEANGGDMSPAALERELKKGADPLQPRGFFGAGSVNAGASVR